MLSKLTSKKGFTLVELLIVVAIIGILATVGIPTFNAYRARAMKAEARSLLGGLNSAEQAFFSEYSTFGDNLQRVGFDVPQRPGAIYAVGFPQANCNSLGALDTPQPNGVTPNFTRLSALYPNYYAAGTGYTVANGGITNRTPSGGADTCRVGNLGPGNDGTDYLATATGAIARGTTSLSPSDAATCVAGVAQQACQSVFTLTPNGGIVEVSDPL